MKYLRLALVVFASAAAVVRAQDEEERRAPPIEIPDFSNLDEYIYEPRSAVRLGFRMLGGVKANFSGQGNITSIDDPGPSTGANLTRLYHDGMVLPDQRAAPRIDSSGNPVIDPQSGVPISDPVPFDGRTNAWGYIDARQLTGEGVPNGFISFHAYSAEVVDTVLRRQNSRSTNGLDLSVARDMGKLFGRRVSWNLVAGMSVSDISARTTDRVLANLTTITDLYSLYGQVPPEPPYSSPSTTTEVIRDASGNPVMNSDGSQQVMVVDTSVDIANEPANPNTRETFQENDQTHVTNSWKVKGAYLTFHGGAELWIPITARFRAGLGLGAAFVYSGTSYTVTQTYTPDIGADIVAIESSSTYKLLPGYYADASLQFDLTEKTGFFAGAVFQSAGSYTQGVKSATASYATKIDFANQSGVRAGMSVRF